MKQKQNTGLKWERLYKGKLLKRYKRFMVDVELENGKQVTAHCPNSGSMKTCCEPGRNVYLSKSDNLRRKLEYTWEIIEMPGSLVGVNTQVPNRLVKKGIEENAIADLKGYETIITEKTIKNRSRLDLYLTGQSRRPCFVEIKNCSLVENGTAYFPDAITTRGQKHLHALIDLVNAGNRCVIFFLIQRMDGTLFKPADHIDAEYGILLRKAFSAGVEPMAYDVYIDFERIRINEPVLISLDKF